MPQASIHHLFIDEPPANTVKTAERHISELRKCGRTEVNRLTRASHTSVSYGHVDRIALISGCNPFAANGIVVWVGSVVAGEIVIEELRHSYNVIGVYVGDTTSTESGSVVCPVSFSASLHCTGPCTRIRRSKRRWCSSIRRWKRLWLAWCRIGRGWSSRFYINRICRCWAWLFSWTTLPAALATSKSSAWSFVQRYWSRSGSCKTGCEGCMAMNEVAMPRGCSKCIC